MHYYPHHIGDFIRDTSNLDDHQLVTYLRLVWVYYTDEKPITGDAEDIAFAMRSDEKTIRLLLKHFFTPDPDQPATWRHTRCDKEIAAYRDKGQKARDSANARWNKANDMRTHSERNAGAPKNDANHKPITNNQVIPHTPKGVDVLFDTFWQAYPKRIGKDAAKRAFVKRRPDKELTATILRAVAQQKESAAWQKDGGQYIPNPATWINQGRWLDEIDTQQSNTFLGAI